MFAMVAVGGLKLLASHALDRRSSLVTACSLGMAIGVMMVPEALSQLPVWLKNVLSSPVTSAGLTAIALDLTLPKMTDTDSSVLMRGDLSKSDENQPVAHENQPLAHEDRPALIGAICGQNSH